MAVTPFKVFVSGEVLTASDLNSSITTITSGGMSLVSPATVALDMDGLEFILDADADTALTADTDDQIDVKVAGTDYFRFTAGRFMAVAAAIVEAEGVAVASATTTDIWVNDGNTVHITGTTTITSLGTAPQAGAWKKIIFDGALTFTHGANLSLPGSANITTAADDIAFVYADTTTQFDVLYFKKDGSATVIGGTFTSDITMSSAMIIETEGAAIASAGTTNIWVTDGNTVHITGTTTITSLGTAPQAGAWKKIIFDGALILTHGVSLNLPRSANITTAADDIAFVYADTTTQFDVIYFPKTGSLSTGTQTIWVPAAAMKTQTTNGAASGSSESTTNQVMKHTFDFDTTTQEFAQFTVRFPKSWSEAPVTFAPTWTAASGSGGVVFGLAGVAIANDDAIDAAYGTAQTSTDTLITALDVHVGPTSSPITIAGIPDVGDWVSFRVNRTVADGSDTLGVDALLMGVTLFFTTDAPEDT